MLKVRSERAVENHNIPLKFTQIGERDTRNQLDGGDVGTQVNGAKTGPETGTEDRDSFFKIN